MKPEIVAAVIAFGGVFLGGLLTFVTQHVAQRSEWQRLLAQLAGEESSRVRERRRERLLDSLAALLAASDPQSEELSYTEGLKHIHHAQLLLDPRLPSEAVLNGAVSRVGLALHSYIPASRAAIGDKVPETQRLLTAHSELVESVRALFREGSNVQAT